jgi:phosphoglycerate dehydrogenase-like enzyme
VHALRSGKVSHALLDVLENETGAHESESLVGMPGVVTTPHIAFYADDSLRNMYHDCFESIEQWQRGERPAHTVEPLHVVPAAQG